jgi:thioredoxin 1
MKIFPTLAKVTLTIVAIYIATLVLSRATASPPPTLFTDISIPEGRIQIAGTKKLLVVDVWASWCPPCREMKKDTWIDPQVEKWVADNAVALAIDADNPGPESSNLHVRALPTIIVYADRGGGVEEVARKVGYVGPEELLEWLGGLAAKSG